MASEVTVEFNEFASAGARSAIQGASVATAVRLRSEAVDLAPADTGELKNSLMWRKGWGLDVFRLPPQGGFNEAGGGQQATQRIDEPRNSDEVVVGTAIEYGVYQEFGTRYMPAQPYLRPAADVIRGATAAEIAKRWGNEAMDREFRQRRTRRTTR